MVRTQPSDISVTVRTNVSTVSPGGTVGIFATVQNNSSSKMRVSVWFTSLPDCSGILTMVGGTTAISLNGNQGIQVTMSYPIAPDACHGTYAITFHAKSGAKAAETSATCYLTVQ
jgi:hypothetical protein